MGSVLICLLAFLVLGYSALVYRTSSRDEVAAYVSDVDRISKRNGPVGVIKKTVHELGSIQIPELVAVSDAPSQPDPDQALLVFDTDFGRFKQQP